MGGMDFWWGGNKNLVEWESGVLGDNFPGGGGEGGGEDEQIFSSVGKTLNYCDGFF